MSAQIIDGKAIARAIRERTKEASSKLRRAPALAVVMVGENPASAVYVRNKVKACNEVGITSIEHRLPADSSDERLLEVIRALNEDPCVDGILVQLPLPEHMHAGLILETIDPLKAPYFLFSRELGVINIGGDGIVTVDGKEYALKFKEALYVGRGNQKVTFKSVDPSKPAKFYLNSAPAHKEYKTQWITIDGRKGSLKANSMPAGKMEESNDRVINQLIVKNVLEEGPCQLQMGLTELKPGSVWNTMPAHTHSRRVEAYFYFNVPEGNMICHLMGEPQQQRLLWLANEQAVMSPEWSIHAAAGTSNYMFIWGMAGENLDYNDMDKIPYTEMK